MNRTQPTEPIFEMQRLTPPGDTIILTPQRSLSELDFQEIRERLGELASDPTIRRVVVDLARTDYMGSTALGMLTMLCQRVQGRGGCVAFCNASAHEQELLTITGLSSLWPIYPSRQQALQAVAADMMGGSPLVAPCRR